MTALKTTNMKDYCNSLYDELNEMKSRLGDLIKEIEGFKGGDQEHVTSHADHVREIAKNIDWKLSIIAQACPLDRFAEGAEDTASVPLEEPEARSKRAGGGSVGG